MRFRSGKKIGFKENYALRLSAMLDSKYLFLNHEGDLGHEDHPLSHT